MEGNNKQMIIGAAIVLVVLVAGWWLFTGKKSDTAKQDTTPKTTEQIKTTDTPSKTGTGSMPDTMSGMPMVDIAAGEIVSASDQPAGDSVRIGEARLSRVSWIAVRDGMSILGAKRVDPPQGGGTVSDITVPLLRNTEAGKMYKVVVYADDGDQIFDFKVDALVDGLSTTFSATNGD